MTRRRGHHRPSRIAAGHRVPRDPAPGEAVHPVTARLRLLEFVWSATDGVQPVLYVDRELLH